MNKNYLKIITHISFFVFIVIEPLLAVQGLMNHGGYNYRPSVIINWGNLEKPTFNKKKIVKKIDYQDLNFSDPKSIIIDSSTVGNKTNLDYVIIQETDKKYSYKSLSQNQTSKNNQKLRKSAAASKNVMKKKNIAMKTQKKYLPTRNVIIEEPRFVESNKNKKIRLANKKVIPLNLDNYEKSIEKSVEKNQQIKIKINNQYANVDNPFDDSLDSPVDSETLKSNVKKTKATNYNPLTRHHLSDYTVKGVITSNQGNRALITTNEGNYFYLTEGELIGIDEGVVVKISNNSVVILQRDRRIEIIVSSDGRASRK